MDLSDYDELHDPEANRIYHRLVDDFKNAYGVEPSSITKSNLRVDAAIKADNYKIFLKFILKHGIEATDAESIVGAIKDAVNSN